MAAPPYLCPLCHETSMAAHPKDILLKQLGRKHPVWVKSINPEDLFDERRKLVRPGCQADGVSLLLAQ